MTTVSLDEKQIKSLMKQAMLELFEERSDLFSAIILEAIEDIGLANAIRQGRKNEFVDEEAVEAILKG
jgi:hypothetical protein